MNVMVSYRSDDLAFVERLVEQLAPHDVRPWVDTTGVREGMPWRSTVLRQLQECDVCLPVLSKRYLASEHCRMEVFVARSFGKKIAPVMIEDCFTELRAHEETKGLEDIFMVLTYKSAMVGRQVADAEMYERLAAGVMASGPSAAEGERPVYISYSEREAALATTIALGLRERGMPAWVATLDCRVGENWREAQARAMLRACAHVIVLDAQAGTQTVLRTELLIAEARDLPVFTVYPEALVNDKESRDGLIVALNRGHETYRRLTSRRGFYVQQGVESMIARLADALGQHVPPADQTS